MEDRKMRAAVCREMMKMDFSMRTRTWDYVREVLLSALGQETVCAERCAREAAERLGVDAHVLSRAVSAAFMKKELSFDAQTLTRICEQIRVPHDAASENFLDNDL